MNGLASEMQIGFLSGHSLVVESHPEVMENENGSEMANDYDDLVNHDDHEMVENGYGCESDVAEIIE